MVGENELGRCVREAASGKGSAFPDRGVMNLENAEVARLRKEFARTKAERDIFKKSHRLLCQGNLVRFVFIAQQRAIWQTQQICETLGVSRAEFYERLGRPENGHTKANRELLAVIRNSFGDNRCSANRVARLTLAAGLKARRKRGRLPDDTGVRPESSIAPNALDRQFVATAPNQRWVADFTYLWTDEG